uniref:Uncharacterized protein n=1 Tax=Rhizophora mucronata TaxID=61149 RepID=A0A2P2MZ63_RHIMU
MNLSPVRSHRLCGANRKETSKSYRIRLSFTISHVLKHPDNAVRIPIFLKTIKHHVPQHNVSMTHSIKQPTCIIYTTILCVQLYQ